MIDAGGVCGFSRHRWPLKLHTPLFRAMRADLIAKSDLKILSPGTEIALVLRAD